MTNRQEKIRVWPEMVMQETLAAIIATIVLLLLSMFIDAPLEHIADPSTSTNPSKAPWYFLGLQELLVYFSPWVAGVLIPICILGSLAAIPYIDIKSMQSGDKSAYSMESIITIAFSGGMVLWVILTVTGVFLRGPNWRLQWLDGTPIGANTAVMPMAWLAPMIAAVYILSIVCKPARYRKHIRMVGLWRFFMAHSIVLGGLVVTVTIVLYTFLSL